MLTHCQLKPDGLGLSSDNDWPFLSTTCSYFQLSQDALEIYFLHDIVFRVLYHVKKFRVFDTLNSGFCKHLAANCCISCNSTQILMLE